MKFKVTVAPVALLVAGSFGSAAHATTVITTDYHPTDAGTQITLEGASSPQFTFINDYTFMSAKAYLQGNNGAMVASPFDPFGYTSGAYTSGYFGGDGDYGITFSANGTQYHGFATVTDMGQTISQISYDVGGVPEPATWAMMVLGLGLAGGALRRSKRRQAALASA